jgi:cyclic pyranopterin phosphate synthase
VVVLRNLNDNEISGFLQFIEGREIVLQLIELERVGCGENIYSQYYVDLGNIENKLKVNAEKVTVKPLHNRRVYHLKGSRIKVEMVRPFHNSEFCMNCRRLRVTADGKLKPCLMRTDNHLDVLPILRGTNFDEKALEEAFRKVVEVREPYYPTYLLKEDKKQT